mmetsp:Transcript_47133/g.102560  ORF Transcript_47133/g.102560 Transcript_47133/m.102560 type:complete len:156 (-) Transcript_47133:829-1296(-)
MEAGVALWIVMELRWVTRLHRGRKGGLLQHRQGQSQGSGRRRRSPELDHRVRKVASRLQWEKVGCIIRCIVASRRRPVVHPRATRARVATGTAMTRRAREEALMIMQDPQPRLALLDIVHRTAVLTTPKMTDWMLRFGTCWIQRKNRRQALFPPE